MKLLNALWIFLALGVGSSIFAMDEHDRYAFRCKVPVEREARSLPSGTTASAGAATPKVDAKVRAEKLAEFGTLQVRKVYGEDLKKLIRNAIEKYGIHPNEIREYMNRHLKYYPDLLQCVNDDNVFLMYLLEKGLDTDRWDLTGKLNSYVTLLPLAQLMILKGAEIKDAMTFDSLLKNPKLAFLYYSCGANVAAVDSSGCNGLMKLCRVHWGSVVDNRVQLAKNLVALGVSLDSRIIEGFYAGCDYKQLLEKCPGIAFPYSDKTKLREAIDEAIQKNANARSQGLPVIAKELAHHFRSGPRQIEDLVISYIGHIIPDDVLREIDEVDREANQGLAQLGAVDKGDEKSN